MFAACEVNGLTGVLARIGKPFISGRCVRSLVALGFVAALTGCGISRQVEQEGTESAALNLNQALAECRNGYPDQITQAVARATCVIKATEPLRPLLPFPELLDRENDLRKSLAAQVQSGSMSLLERNLQMTKFHASLLVEENSRLKEKPTEVAPAVLGATQWRLSNSEGCTSLGGNTANCF
jgi:hypothetical protein